MSLEESTVENPWYSLKEAANSGYPAYSTLRKYISDGRLPAVKMGRRIMVRKQDLDSLAKPMQGMKNSQAIKAAIERVVAESPSLTTEQRERLAAVLRTTSEHRPGYSSLAGGDAV